MAQNYSDQIASNANSNGTFRMYRTMSKAEAEKGGLHTKRDYKDQDLWLSSSMKHQRNFVNKAHHTGEEVTKEFTVNAARFRQEFPNESIIHQQGSSQVNRYLPLGQKKNLVHNEGLKRHEGGKLNFCAKGQDNAERFNRCIDDQKIHTRVPLDPQSGRGGQVKVGRRRSRSRERGQDRFKIVDNDQKTVRSSHSVNTSTSSRLKSP